MVVYSMSIREKAYELIRELRAIDTPSLTTREKNQAIRGNVSVHMRVLESIDDSLRGIKI